MRKFGVLIAATVLTLLVLNAVVSTRFPVLAQVYVADEALLHDAQPSSARIQPMDSRRLGPGDVGRVYVGIGPDGFRGQGLESPKTRKRVLVLGDSFVMAENVPLERTFVSRLGEELGRRLGDGESIEAVNAGRSGYGPDQALRLFEERADEIDADAVVFVLCAHNDYGDLMRNKLYRIEGSGGDDDVLVRLAPTLGARVTDRFARIAEGASAPALVRLWRFWRDAEGARRPIDSVSPGTMNLYVTALRAQTREHIVDRNAEVVSLFEDVYDIDMAAPVAPDSSEPKAKLMAAVLGEAIRFASRRGTPLVFLIVPSAVDVCADFGITVDATRFPGYRSTAIVESMVGAVGLGGGVAIDLTPALTGSGAADRYFVGGTDIHWNAAGQDACASFAAESLLRDRAFAAALED